MRLHRLLHWEYWPTSIVYLPSFFLWIWYSVKFRSFKFYSAVNPAIENGGLYGDSKMDIYKLLPENLYPRTVLIRVTDKSDVLDLIDQSDLRFPMILKPDVGLRGRGVHLAANREELVQMIDKTYTDFLLQEYCSFPNEIGVFYYRMPNSKHGRISGITRKKFLTVIGDGSNSIRELLKKIPRHRMQIPALVGKFDLDEVLPIGEERCLVPFGNHNRGTRFTDGSDIITPELEKMLDEILQKIEGFYFGRLDIRFNTLEELIRGKNWMIIELNGAKSEPTHIYDPKYGFWYGQKEIFRHQRIMHDIIKMSIRTKSDRTLTQNAV